MNRTYVCISLGVTVILTMLLPLAAVASSPTTASLTATCTKLADRAFLEPRDWSSYHIVLGTSGDDVLAGTAQADLICGFGGDDKIVGRGGNDVIIGGLGGDILSGGAGADLLLGGRGRDQLWGQAGWDDLRDGPGQGALHGGRGDDLLLARCGSTAKLFGDLGADRFDANNGQPNVISGGPGEDRAFVDFSVDSASGVEGLERFGSGC